MNINQEVNSKISQGKQPHDTREGHMSVFSRFSSRTLFVRDLPYSCTSQDLKNLFCEELGIYIARALVCDNRQQKPLHFGYVLLPDEEMVQIAVNKLNGCRFRGRDIRVEPYKAVVMLETANMGAIHVTFKAQSARISLITEATLRDFFENFGEIQQVVIRKHELTEDGRQHGFAFLTFKHHEINEQVVELVRKHLVGEILYDCAWSKQYLDSLRKDQQNPNNNSHSQHTSNASSISDGMGFQSPFKGSTSYAATPLGVSRAGSLEFYDQGGNQAEISLRNSFYAVGGTSTPTSLSFDAYENGMAASTDSRWIAPANSIDANNVEVMMGRRSETPGQNDISAGGIAFSKLSISSPTPSHSMSYDRQDYAGNYIQTSNNMATMRTLNPTPPNLSAQAVNSRQSAFPPKQFPYQNIDHGLQQARVGGLRKQTLAPQYTTYDSQTQSRSLNYHQQDPSQPAPAVHMYPPGLSSWSADMMDDYSSAMRMNNNNDNNNPQMISSSKFRASDAVHVGRTMNNYNQQQPPQHQYAQQQLSQHSHIRSNGTVTNNSSSNTMMHYGIAPQHRAASTSPHSNTPVYSVQTQHSTYSPSITTSTASSTGTSGYNRADIQSFSPQLNPNNAHYGMHRSMVQHQSSPYTPSHSSGSNGANNRMEEIMQRPSSHASPSPQSRLVHSNSSSSKVMHPGAVTPPSSRMMMGVNSLSQDELDDTNKSTQRNVPGFFHQFSPGSSKPMGVPRTQSESAIGFSSVSAQPSSNKKILLPSAIAHQQEVRHWLSSPSYQNQQPASSGNPNSDAPNSGAMNLPPRGNAHTSHQHNHHLSQINSHNRVLQSEYFHPFISTGVNTPTSSNNSGMNTSLVFPNSTNSSGIIRTFSGSEPVSANNSFHNSFDEYESHQFSQQQQQQHQEQQHQQGLAYQSHQVPMSQNINFAMSPSSNTHIHNSNSNSNNTNNDIHHGSTSGQSGALELSFMTYDHGTASAVSSTSALSTPAGVKVQPSIEDLIMCDDLLASNSNSKDPDTFEHANQSSISLFSFSDSSSPRLDGSRIPSLSSFSVETTAAGKPTPNMRVQSILNESSDTIHFPMQQSRDLPYAPESLRRPSFQNISLTLNNDDATIIAPK